MCDHVGWLKGTSVSEKPVAK